MKYTPGPWHFDEELCAVFPAREVSGVSIAQIVVTDGQGLQTDKTRQIGEANAHLISAAPEMLEMLEEIHDLLFYDPEMQDKIYRIIEKARGESENDYQSILDKMMESPMNSLNNLGVK